jgi:CubicO group peptidase (beta-lactamase class C family)
MLHGEVSPGWEPLEDAFAAVLEEDEAGAAVAIVHEGRLVVDLWGGTDPLSGRAWEQDSVVLAFSAAKGIVALLVAQQIAAGSVDADAPVARYWREFAAAGKAGITLRDVLTHVAGVPVLPLRSVRDLLDPVDLAARLAAQPPSYSPRSARIYHILSYGTILAEVLRRVTGRDLGELLREQVASPLEASMWFGTSGAAEARVLLSLMGPVEPAPLPEVTAGPNAAACRAAYDATAQIIPLFERVDGALGTETMNTASFRRAQIGGGGLVSDARSLARVYGACVAEVDGVRLLDDETVALVSADHLDGIAEPMCRAGAGTTSRWGLGFEIAHPANPMLGPGSFGHAGMGGRLAFAHAPSRLGFAFVGQRMSFPPPGEDRRWQRLLTATAAVLG